MPAEFEEQEGVWISFPKNRGTFPDEIIEKVEETFVKIIKTISEDEKIFLLVDNEREEKRIQKIIGKGAVLENVIYHKIKSSDVWIRDYGPTFVKDSKGEVFAIKWTYNAYGNKYDDLKFDNSAGKEVAKASKKKIIDPQIILEGGSIEVNGKGTLITTEQCLLNQNRNSKLTKEEIETKLKDLLGVTNIIWLGEGVVGDDTDGHIDDIARFVDEKTIVCAYEENEKDENYLALKKDYEKLCESVDQEGKKFKVIKIPMPKPKFSKFGRVPASYANFLITNKSVLLPVFNDENDEVAIKILQKLMPQRRIVPIDCTYHVWGLGTIHCSSQQQPK